jgi:hypothetical protein
MTNLKIAAKIFTAVSILFFAISTDAQTPDSIYKIQKGTRIRLKMESEINSKVFSPGDTFRATVAVPVKFNEIEMLPAGTVIEGKILRVKKASVGGSNGRMEVKFETLYLTKDIKLRIDASLAATEKPKSSQAAKALTIAGATGAGALIGMLVGKSKGAIVGAGAAFGISAGAILLKKGKEARINAGEEFEILLNQDVDLPPADY